jgi:AbrB family looped-hinge helix DNA binding protein
MATRMSAQGRVTIPKKIRTALQLAPGDRVDFEFNGGGELVLHKAPAAPAPAMHSRVGSQLRRRAQELIALLHGLD